MSFTQVWLYATQQSEPLRQTGLLLVLAGGIGHGDTLLQSLKAHESESPGTWASKICQLRTLLEQGHSLSDAIANVQNLLPDQTVAAIRIGERTGTLANVLVEEASRISRFRSGSSRAEGTLVYMFSVGVIAACMVSFLCFFIVPKMKAIFEGFGLQLPRVTLSLIVVIDWLLQYWAVLAIPILAATFFLQKYVFRSAKHRLIRGYPGGCEHWPRYWVPTILRQLSLAAASGHPLTEALGCAIADLPPGLAATRISAVRQQAANGEDVVSAMAAHGLLRQREAVFLQAAAGHRHLDWGLRHLADSIEYRRSLWGRLIVEMTGPVIILLMGAVVLFICAAFFSPIIEMIEQLSRQENG